VNTEQITVNKAEYTAYQSGNRVGQTYLKIGYHKPDGSWLNLKCDKQDLFALLVQGAVGMATYDTQTYTDKMGQQRESHEVHNFVIGGNAPLAEPQQQMNPQAQAAITQAHKDEAAKSRSIELQSAYHAVANALSGCPEIVAKHEQNLGEYIGIHAREMHEAAFSHSQFDAQVDHAKDVLGASEVDPGDNVPF
jgi:hypothetical protein